MNTFMNGLSNSSNFTFTENGALTHKTTKSDLLDMFAMGAAYRTRSDSDVILMFRKEIQLKKARCELLKQACTCGAFHQLIPDLQALFL